MSQRSGLFGSEEAIQQQQQHGAFVPLCNGCFLEVTRRFLMCVIMCHRSRSDRIDASREEALELRGWS